MKALCYAVAIFMTAALVIAAIVAGAAYIVMLAFGALHGSVTEHVPALSFGESCSATVLVLAFVLFIELARDSTGDNGY